MPPETPVSFKITRATTNRPWWNSTLSEGTYDLSDHHPCEFQIGELKGITYNIQCLPGVITPAVGKQNKQDIQAFSRELANWFVRDNANYDVICVQELLDQTATATFEKAMSEKGYTVHTSVEGGRITGAATSAGVRIFTKKSLYAEEGDGHIYRNKMDDLKEGNALTDKGIKHVVVTKENVRYHVLDTHLQASYNDPSQQYYMEVTLAQLLELKHYIETQRQLGRIRETDQVVLCGDFNIPKDAQGSELDAVSCRGKWFFERAQHLLGPGFQLLQQQTTAEENQPTCTFDFKTNSYLNGSLGNKKETMSANLDLVFSVNLNPAPSSDLLFDELLSQLQIHLARIVRDNIRMLTLKGLYQLPEKDRMRIDKLSIAMDNLIECLPKDPFSSNKMKEAVTNILEFSKGLLLRDQIAIERLITGVMLTSKAPPEVQQEVKQALENSVNHILDPRALNCVREKWKKFREDVFNDKPLSIENVNHVLLDKKEIKPYVEDEINRLNSKGKQLKNFHPEVTQCISALSDSLRILSDNFFSNQCSREAYIKDCEAQFSRVKDILNEHRGSKRWLGSFLIGVGQLLGLPSWAEKGREYHAFETDSMHHLNRFKGLGNTVTKDDESFNPGSLGR